MKRLKLLTFAKDCNTFAFARKNGSKTVLQVLVLLSFGFLAFPSFACSCFRGSLESSFANAEVVIEAKKRPGTTRYDNRETFDGIDEMEKITTQDRVSLVDVFKVWKGESTDAMTIRSGGENTCGYLIPEDQPVILFASFLDETTTVEGSEDSVPEKVERPLYTWYCSDNVELRDDAASQSIEQKLDRLQQKAAEAHKTKKHRAVLRERIREILKSVEDQPSHSVK